MSEKAVDCIDLGSWARFTPSLVSFLSNDVDVGARLVFYVGQPLLAPGTQLTAPGLANKLLRRKAKISSDKPGIAVLVEQAQGALSYTALAPRVDGLEQLLLGPAHVMQLALLGWDAQPNAVTFKTTDAAKLAEILTRSLLEVFKVAHPADLGLDLA